MILAPDRKFRIRDKTTEIVTDADKKDKRNKNRGRICDIWQKGDLVDVLWKLNIMPFKTQVTESRAEMISYLERIKGVQTKDRIISQFPDDKLNFFFVWLRTEMNKSQICTLLQNEFQKMGRLLVM